MGDEIKLPPVVATLALGHPGANSVTIDYGDRRVRYIQSNDAKRKRGPKSKIGVFFAKYPNGAYPANMTCAHVAAEFGVTERTIRKWRNKEK